MGTTVASLLILFTESLGVCFAVWIKEFFAAFLPCGFEFGRGDVPVRPAFLGHSTQVLAEIFDRRAAKEPIAVVDFVDDQAGLKNNRVGDHGIVHRVGVLSDVEIFLNSAPRVGEKRPMGADGATIFVGLGDIVGANRNQAAIANLDLTMKLNQAFMLPAVLRAVTSAA